MQADLVNLSLLLALFRFGVRSKDSIPISGILQSMEHVSFISFASLHPLFYSGIILHC
jgi:hypothetical protein